VSGFQLCYDMQGIEYALMWVKGYGMDHHRIDSDEASLLKNMKPVLIPDGTVPSDKLLRIFTKRGVNIVHELYTLERRKLSESKGEVNA
jgi:hypothetical protein